MEKNAVDFCCPIPYFSTVSNPVSLFIKANSPLFGDVKIHLNMSAIMQSDTSHGFASQLR